MSNYQKFGQQVTEINLLDLAEMDDRNSYQEQAMNRNIRQDYRGMQSSQPQSIDIPQGRIGMQQSIPLQGRIDMQQQMRPNIPQVTRLEDLEPEINTVPNVENKNIKTFVMPDNTPTCLDVAEHIANCPICSKFYNHDKALYIVAIVILAVVCVILLKKVIDGNK